MLEYTEHFNEYSCLKELDICSANFSSQTFNLLLNRLSTIKSLKRLVISCIYNNIYCKYYL